MKSRTILTVTILTALSLSCSLLNQVALAYLFGASVSVDAFLAAGALPMTVQALAIGDLTYVLVPMLMVRRDDVSKQRDLTNRLFSFLLLAGFALVLVGVLGHRVFLRLTTSSAMPRSTFELAARVAPLAWVVLGLSLINGLFTGLHHFRRSFIIPSLCQPLPYVGMIVGGLGGAHRFGIESVAVGWVLGGVLRTSTLYMGFSGRRELRLRSALWHPEIWEFCKSLFPMGLSLLMFAALPMVDVYWASRLPEGSISYLGYSTRIVIAMTALVVQGISVVVFPDLSESMADRRFDEFKARVSKAIKAVLLVIIPLAAVVTALRQPILAVLFQRGNFHHAATMRVARVLPWYMLGTIGMAAMNIVSRGFYALKDYWTPAKWGLISLASYTILSGALIKPFSYVGVGIAYAIYWILVVFLQMHLLGLAAGRLLTRGLFIFLCKVLASSLPAGLLVALIATHLTTTVGLLPDVIVCGICGAGSFILLAYVVFRIPDLRMLVAAVMNR